WGCGGAPLADPGVLSILPGAADPCVPNALFVRHLDEPTALGFSAVEVLERLAGPRLSPVDWLEPEPNDEYVLEYGPERGSGGLELDVRLRDGPLVLRQPSPRFDAPEDTTCPPGSLQIPVEVTLRSSGLSLDEAFDTTLEASVPYQGHLNHMLTARTLHGLLFSRIVSLDPGRGYWVGPLGLEALLWEGGSMGSLSLQLGGNPPPSAQPPALATWPSAGDCPGGASYLPSDAPVLGFSARDVLARLGAPAARSVTWSDGSLEHLVLELDAPEPELCQELGEALRFNAVLRARSEDNGLDVRLPVRVEAQGDAGEIGAISVESSEPETPQTLLEAATRRAESRLGRYRALLVALDWTRLGESDSGSLALRGVEASEPDAEGRFASSTLSDGRW
ncbi:MAG TPA: hypothetical protein VNN80_35390, partial [Polyangiaceae bacterium]|nr:hypothetical protein [Polyangiaceae bacterium]